MLLRQRSEACVTYNHICHTICCASVNLCVPKPAVTKSQTHKPLHNTPTPDSYINKRLKNMKKPYYIILPFEQKTENIFYKASCKTYKGSLVTKLYF